MKVTEKEEEEKKTGWHSMTLKATNTHYT